MKFIIANWKIYLSLKEQKDLAWELSRHKVGIPTEVSGKIKKARKDVVLVLCPSFDALESVGKIVKKSVFALGAQDCFYENQGAYTGEVSPKNLKDAGCEYAIVGHSERRKLGETDTAIAKKVKAVLEHKLAPILCIGETSEENKSGKKNEVLERQIRQDLSLATITCYADHKKCERILVAYEPVWAIGTGVAETPENARDTHKFIRQILDKYFPSISRHIHIIYGGSVNLKNISSFLEYPEIEGALIGGASAKAEEFIKIMKSL